MSERVVDFTKYDVTQQVTDAMRGVTERNVVYIPALATQIARAIRKVDPSAPMFHGTYVLDGVTPFDVSKMQEYAHRWDDSAICCDCAHVMVACITQDAVDAIAQECSDNVSITYQ